MGSSRLLNWNSPVHAIPESMKNSKVYGLGSKWAFHEGKTGRSCIKLDGQKESKWNVCENEQSKGQRLVDLKGWN